MENDDDAIGPGEYKVTLGLKRFFLPKRDSRYICPYFKILPCPNREVYIGFDEASQEPVFNPPSHIDNHYPVCEYYMEIPFNTNKAIDSNDIFDMGSNKALWAINLLWLFKKGNIFYYVHDITGPGISKNPRYWRWARLGMPRNLEPPMGRGDFRLDSNYEMRKLSTFTNKYYDLDLTSIDTVLRRVATYNNRDWSSDLVVDLFIILESLFVFGHENVSYQVRLKTASFLKGTIEIKRLRRNPNDIFNFIQKAYQTRSSIVHGDKEGQKWLHGEFTSGGFTRHNVLELEEIVRSCVRVALDWILTGKSLNPKSLDKELFLS